MREIKFRAWDDEIKQMLPPVDISQSKKYWKWLGVKDLELMQYTGLTDKNGKEIYEGDIVKNTKHKEQLVEVFWKGSVIQKSDGWIKWGGWYFRTIKKDGPLDYATYSNHIEVIGNIYENPNLLN